MLSVLQSPWSEGEAAVSNFSASPNSETRVLEASLLPPALDVDTKGGFHESPVSAVNITISAANVKYDMSLSGRS